MKSILKIGIAALLALTPALVHAATGDAILFSTSASDPNAGTALTINSVGGTGTLYVWVTSSSGTSDITPLSTALTGGGSPTGAAAIAFNGAITGGTATLTAGQFYNFDPAVPASSIYAYAGTPPVSRWSAVTPTVTGTSFTNFTANTAMQSPNGTTFPAGTITGLSRANIDASANADPLYFEGVTVPNGSTGGAWLLGQFTVQGTASGLSTLTLSPSSLDITKSGPGGTTVLTSAYSYGSATINVSQPPLLGDANLDNMVNLTDLNGVINNFGTNNPGGDAAHDGNPTGLTDLNAVINNFGASQGAGSVAPVPEPASFGLLAIGSVLALAYRARRRS